MPLTLRLLTGIAALIVAVQVAPAQPVGRVVYSGYMASSIYPFGGAGGSGIPLAIDRQGDTVLAFRASMPGSALDQPSLLSAVLLTKVSANGAERMIGVVDYARPNVLLADAASNLYLAGETSGAFGATKVLPGHESGRGFIAKLDREGKVIWSVRLAARPYAMALGSEGSIYLTGMAQSDFPTTETAFQRTPKPCSARGPSATNRYPFCTEAFVAKIAGDGARVAYASFLGGTGEEYGNAISVDSGGNVYVVGETLSNDFPTTPGAVQPGLGGVSQQISDLGQTIAEGGDAFLAKLDATGGRLLYSTYLGGSGADYAVSMVLDAQRNVYITGTTGSRDFPVTANAFQQTYGGGADVKNWQTSRTGDAFFASFDAAGNPRYVSYFGTRADEVGTGAALDSRGRFYFLEGSVKGAPCQSVTSVVVIDPGSGGVADRATLNHILALVAGLALDSSGVVRVAGTTIADGYPLAGVGQFVTGGGTWLFMKVDMSRSDEFVPRCVANAASSASKRQYGGAPLSVARGEIISVIGVGVGPSAEVRLDDRELPVLYSDPNRVDALVPTDVTLGSAQITIKRGGFSASYRTEVTAMFPGIFTSDGTHAIALNEDLTENGPSNPAARGSIITVLATGLGPLEAGLNLPLGLGFHFQTGVVLPANEGRLSWYNSERGEVISAGPVPEWPGIYEIRVRMPAAVVAGEPLILLWPYFSQNQAAEPSQAGVRVFVAE